MQEDLDVSRWIEMDDRETSYSITDYIVDSDAATGSSEYRNLDSPVTGGSSTPFYTTTTSDPMNPDTIGECAIVTGKVAVCADSETYGYMQQLAPDFVSDVSTWNGRRALIEAVKQRLHVDDERAIIASNRFREAAGGRKSVEILSRYYKVEGPTDVTLLSNVHIDLTIRQWLKRFPKLFHYNFNMRDYKKTGDTLATIGIDQVRANGFETAACVINNDYSYNRGKHWMALFVDMRTTPYTVEFFNSSGNSPDREFNEWMVESVDRLRKSGHQVADPIIVSRIKHQYSRTECGVYALWYIWGRLNGRTWVSFSQTPIPDTDMFRFRQHLFYDSKRKQTRQFSLEEFNKSANPKWE